MERVIRTSSSICIMRVDSSSPEKAVMRAVLMAASKLEASAMVSVIRSRG